MAATARTSIERDLSALLTADGVLRTLEQRGYITEVARDPGPGQALLYGTTSLLLEPLALTVTVNHIG